MGASPEAYTLYPVFGKHGYQTGIVSISSVLLQEEIKESGDGSIVLYEIPVEGEPSALVTVSTQVIIDQDLILQDK